ncbi:peptide chain release factor N(5)-glutamine methyltransferase [Halocynthiibacter styelae]|uniref:Release factor glutamine methyltransferase n=1 Tax=Halocynthiibacter styelae TaxID=2761955 RepID=A0A8J7LWB7_9RHOB|nr:peptide chain release factor N(5)-glutamine methyltransferase [Paenihalocynthiibacter styelae]MBI1494137.1 peptide chain release factor N(5)-glutamine methyltransferase [Paenihalocynthiibacter styelae]
MRAQEVLFQGVQQLKEAAVPGAANDARRLMAWAMQVEPGRLTLALGDDISDVARARFESAIKQRFCRVPVSHITGTRAFFGRDFHVSSAVLDPRPETERLVEIALQHPGKRLLDLGTGSGAIAVSVLAERPDLSGQAFDISVDALEVAKRNAETHGVAGRLELKQSDWFGEAEGHYDLILSNPPYITSAEMQDLQPEVFDHEPHIALTPYPNAENDGLAPYRIITAQIQDYLSPGGLLAVECGLTQGQAIQLMFEVAGLTDVQIHKDLDGRDRVVAGKMPV